MEFQIADYSNKYAEALNDIYLSGRRLAFPWIDPETYKSADFDRDTAGEKIWVALSGQIAIGFISCWEPDHFVHCLFIKPDFHGLGIGKALLQVCLAHLGRPATLKCVAANRNAIAFYQKLGWQIAGSGESPEGPYLLMEYANNHDTALSQHCGQ